MIPDLHRQGAVVSAIARRTRLNRKTVHKVIAGGLEPEIYGARQCRTTQLQRFEPFLRERLRRFPNSTAALRRWLTCCTRSGQAGLGALWAAFRDHHQHVLRFPSSGRRGARWTFVRWYPHAAHVPFWLPD